MSNYKKIDDVVFPAYGPEYAALTNAGLEDGFFLSDHSVSTDNGSALLVF